MRYKNQKKFPKKSMNLTKIINKTKDFFKNVGVSPKNKFIVAGVSSLALVIGLGSFWASGLKNDQEIYEEHLLSIQIPHPSVALAAHGIEGFQIPSFIGIKNYELRVDDKVVANFKTEKEATDLLETLKSRYKREDSELLDVSFKERVAVVEAYTDVTRLGAFLPTEDILSLIEKGTDEERTHTVQKGENYWTIGQIYGVKPEDLEAANPGVNPLTIQIGQEISLIVPTPIINVVTTEQIEFKDSIAYEVAYEDTSSLYKGETRVKIAGSYGEKSVVAMLIRENGREVRREIVSETVVSQPVTRVVYKGTKNPPPRMGTGTLIHPTGYRGYVSSEFGWRWGGRHTGIDVAMPTGSPVLASDGGTVTFSGWSSSYGYYIIVNHGANISTLYAHNSSNLVSVGTQVFQGQTIAYSGNTGYSTGPHLHFEIRVNNVPQNPRNYIGF